MISLQDSFAILRGRTWKIANGFFELMIRRPAERSSVKVAEKDAGMMKQCLRLADYIMRLSNALPTNGGEGMGYPIALVMFLLMHLRIRAVCYSS